MIVKIGRGRDNNIVLSNPTVSRRHAALEIEDGHIVLKDLGSTSGTYLVGATGELERTTYMVVTENDTIAVGNERLFIKDIIDQMAKETQQTKYERNPVTGEIVKK